MWLRCFPSRENNFRLIYASHYFVALTVLFGHLRLSKLTHSFRALRVLLASMSLSCVRSIKTLCVFSVQIIYSIRVNLLHRVCAGGSVFQYRHSPPVSLLVQQTGAFCAGKPCLKRELYGIAHGKIFFCEQLTNFSVKDNVVKMPYGGSKFRLRFFGTIMLTPCKANLAGRFMYLSCGVNFSTNPSFTSSSWAGEPRLRHKIICKYAPPRAEWPGRHDYTMCTCIY